MKNIGITISLKSETQSIWENGILQNVVHFYNLLLNIGKYNIILLNTNESISDFSQLTWKTYNINIKNISEVIDDIDILFIMGSQIQDSSAQIVKNNNGKIIAYYCGNHYILEMENVLFKNKDTTDLRFVDYLDDIWMIPQIYDSNKYYLELLHKTKSKSVPFLWDSFFIDQLKPKLKNNGEYLPSNNKKRISTFEPNLNVVKYCMYPLLIFEDFYTSSHLKNNIEFMSITNTDQIKNNAEFVRIVNHLDIVKEKKVFFESRYNTPYFLSEHTDIVIEHQWENALNYLYLDVCYLGYPLIHNADLIKNMGYFYAKWDVKKASKHLENILKYHDENTEEYNSKNKTLLDTFRPNNEFVLETYEKLINKI